MSVIAPGITGVGFDRPSCITLTQLTAMGWACQLSDRGGNLSQPIWEASRNFASSADIYFVWEDNAVPTESMWIGSYDGAGGSVSASFASRPAVGQWFHWYVTCSGTGAGQLVAGYWIPGTAAYVTASTTLDAASTGVAGIRFGFDGFGNFSNIKHAAYKQWDVVLPDAQIVAERWHVEPQRRTNCVSALPMHGISLAESLQDLIPQKSPVTCLLPGSIVLGDNPPALLRRRPVQALWGRLVSTTKTAVESLRVALSEAASVLVSVAQSDSLRVQASDAAAVQAFLAAADTLGLASSESAAVTALITAADTLQAVLGETASVAAFVAAADAAGLSLAEFAALLVSVAAADAPGVRVSDAAAVLALLAASEGLAAQVGDAAALLASVAATEAAALAVSEVAVVTALVVALETLAAALSELAAIVASSPTGKTAARKVNTDAVRPAALALNTDAAFAAALAVNTDARLAAALAVNTDAQLAAALGVNTGAVLPAALDVNTDARRPAALDVNTDAVLPAALPVNTDAV